MPTSAEVAHYLQGAWLLAQGNRRGIDFFDLSVEGFWRSFSAALIVAPAYLLLLLERYAATGWPEQTVLALFAELVAYVLGWALFPVVAIFLTRLLGLTSRYIPLVVAANWSAVLQVALYTAAVTISFILPGDLRSVLVLSTTLVILFYQGFVVRTALQTTTGIAASIVIIDILLAISLNRAVDGLLQPA